MGHQERRAETQAAGTAADAVEFAKALWGLIQDPSANPLRPAVRHARLSGLVIDAKSFYDSGKKESATHSVACKRTAAELRVLRQTLRHTGTVLRWVSSESQLTDGSLKVNARQMLAEKLQLRTSCLMCDASFTAAKRKDAEGSTQERQGRHL